MKLLIMIPSRQSLLAKLGSSLGRLTTQCAFSTQFSEAAQQLANKSSKPDSGQTSTPVILSPAVPKASKAKPSSLLSPAGNAITTRSLPPYRLKLQAAAAVRRQLRAKVAAAKEKTDGIAAKAKLKTRARNLAAKVKAAMKAKRLQATSVRTKVRFLRRTSHKSQ